MTEWHCYVDGQQYGPISEDELREWMASGRVKPTDMVWTEGMADWQPAGGIDREQLTAEYPAASGQPQAEPEPPLLDALPGGTGGQAAVGELFSRGLSIVLQSLPLLLVAAFVAYIISSLPSIFETVADYAFEWQPTEQERLLLSLVQLAWLAVVFPVQLGTTALALRVVCRQPARVGDVLSGFRLAGQAIATGLWQAVLILLWSLLLIIPGIIAALRYSQAFFLVAERPGLSGRDALDASKEIMAGHLGRLFQLSLLMFLLGLALMAPWVWVLVTRIIENSQSNGTVIAPVPAWAVVYAMVVGTVLQPLYWIVFAEFHRDLNPPREV